MIFNRKITSSTRHDECGDRPIPPPHSFPFDHSKTNCGGFRRVSGVVLLQHVYGRRNTPE